MYAWCLLNRFGFIFYNRHISTPFFLVSYDVKTVKDTIGPGLDPAMPEFRSLSVGIYRSAFFEPVFHAITQWRLVCFQFYQEITAILSDPVDDILLHGHGIGCDYLSGYIDFIDKPRYGLYLIAFLSAGFGSQCDAGVVRICWHNIRVASVVLHSAALCFAIHTDYLLISVCLGQALVEKLHKLLHPVGKCQIIDAVLHAAESRLGRDTVLQHAQFAEFIKIVPAEFYYLGPAHTLWGAGKYHQHDDVIESVTDISFAWSSKIRDGWGKFLQFVQNTVSWAEFIYYFCDMTVCVRSNRKNWVEWLDLIHNYLICNHKVTKNLPFDLFIQLLILFKIKEMGFIGSILSNHQITPWMMNRGSKKYPNHPRSHSL